VRANDGVLWSAWQSFTVVTDPPVGPVGQLSAPAGTDVMTIQNGGSADLPGPSAVDVDFQGSTGTLQLDQSSAFAGTISGFTGQDRIDLTDIVAAQSSFGWQPNIAGTGGTLSVTDGVTTAKLALLGQYVAANFTLGVDDHGGTIVNDPPLFGPVASSVDAGAAPDNRPMSVAVSNDLPMQVR
jgi:hypothetical protein